MLNAYVSVCPLPEGSGRLAMGQAQKEKRSNTDSGNRSGTYAHTRKSAKVKPISRAARKGNGQIGDELLAHSCDQALRAQSRTARSGRRLTLRIQRSSAGCAHLPATNLPSADPWQQALSLLPSEPSHVVAPTAVPQHHRNAPCKGPPFGDTPSRRPRARARGGPYKGPRDVKASGYAS